MSRHCSTIESGTMIVFQIATGDIRLLTNQCTWTPISLKTINRLKTEITHTLHVKDTGAQYSSPSDSDDSSSSDLDSDIEGTENITVTRRDIHRRSASSEDLYTNPTLPHKRFRTSTPEPPKRATRQGTNKVSLERNHKSQTCTAYTSC